MSIPKGQHYVTKAYLRGFANGTGRAARLYVYERGGEPYAQKPEKAARQNYYYSFEGENGELDHSVEELLGRMESNAMPVLNKVATEDFQPGWEERGWLAGFIALHEMRVPWMREGLDEMTAQMMKHVARVSVSAPGHLEETVERMKAEGKEIGPHFAEEIREVVESDQYELKIDPAHSLALMIEMLPDMTQRYLEMKWTVARTTEDRPFVTGDNPVVRTNPRYTGTFYDGYGVDNKNIEIRFPLNRTTALIITQDMKRVEEWNQLMETGQEEQAHRLRESVPVTTFRKAPPDIVQAINAGTARYAKRFVYAYAKDSAIPEMMGKEPGGLWPRVG